MCTSIDLILINNIGMLKEGNSKRPFGCTRMPPKALGDNLNENKSHLETYKNVYNCINCKIHYLRVSNRLLCPKPTPSNELI